MFCPQCGYQNPDAAKFCMQCGYSYAQAAGSYRANSPSSSSPPAPPTVIVKRGGGGALIFLVLVILGGGAVAVFLLLNSGVLVRQKDWLGREQPIVDVKASDKEISGRLNLPEVQQRRAPTRQSAPPPPPAPPAYDYQPERTTGGEFLVNESFSVPAGAAKWWRFTVPPGGAARVVGDFRASGGSGNDIEVGVTDENGANGHAGRFWYHSGKVTVGNIDVALGPGTYFVVFSNRFSAFSSKSVTASIQLMPQ
jgi:hypothetical protein